LQLSEIEKRVLTKKERDALELRHAGMSLRAISFALDIGLSTVVDRIRRAEQKIVLAQKDRQRS